jgi:uncharacterized protein YecE (DUF72 family)
MNTTNHPILIGCDGWNYPDWERVFYPEGMDARDYLAWYADRFPIAEVDSTFYRPPTSRMVRTWIDHTPADFKFALKVPRVITHDKKLQDCAEEVEGFLSSIRPLGGKLTFALLQMGYFNRGAFASLDDFLEVLDAFLSSWPIREVPLAVEVRNPRWIGPPLADCLRSHDVALTLNDHAWMPRPAQVASQVDPLTGPFGYVRLVGDRDAIEKITTTWDRVVVERDPDLAATADIVRAMAERKPVVILITNHYEGHSPATARKLRQLLDLPDPVPPIRPRTTLFD